MNDLYICDMCLITCEETFIERSNIQIGDLIVNNELHTRTFTNYLKNGVACSYCTFISVNYVYWRVKTFS